MTTKAPAEIKYFDENEAIKKLYSVIDELSDLIPVSNDRNRLSFNLDLYLRGEVINVLEAIIQASPRSSTVKYAELEKIIEKKFSEKGIVKNN